MSVGFLEEVLVDVRSDMEILGQQMFTGEHPGRHFGEDKRERWTLEESGSK